MELFKKSPLYMVIDIVAIVLFYFLLHEKLLDYFDPEGSFILTAGENLFKYGILATPEYQFYGDTAPSSPYYVAYFFAGLSVLLFGHTSLGAVAYVKFFTLLTIVVIYALSRVAFNSRLAGWYASGFLILFPFSREFITTRGDMVSVFFGWLGILLLLLSIKKETAYEDDRPSEYLATAAGAMVALSFFSHPLGFQFYMGACLLIIANYYGIIRWIFRRNVWLFFSGFVAVALAFALFVIDWEKYLYFASQFQGYATQFLPLNQFFGKLAAQLSNVSGPFFFMYEETKWLAADPWYISVLLGLVVTIFYTSLVMKFKNKYQFSNMRCFGLIFFLFLFIYVYALPAYRQYIVHALPLLGVMLGASAAALTERAAKVIGTSKRATVIAFAILAVPLLWASANAIAKNETLFNAPSRYTLIQDAIRDIRSAIPQGSRVVVDVSDIFLFPDNIVRSLLVFQQFKQPPIPDYIVREQKRDGIVDDINSTPDVRLKFNLNARYHLRRLAPNYIATSYYEGLNLSRSVAKFEYTISRPPPAKQAPRTKTIGIYETNYNAWPFINVPVGTRLYPSFSDPISAIRYREFLMKGMAQEIVKPEATVVAYAGEDIAVLISPFDDAAEITLDGSRSYSINGDITRYEWLLDYKTIAEGERTSARLPIGGHTIHLIVSNSDGWKIRDTIIVNVRLDKDSGLVNYALKANGGSASANMTHGGSPDKAIDGIQGDNMNEMWIGERDKSSWWQVDLGGESRKIKMIFIYFRPDYKVDEQTNNIELWASDDPEFKQYEVLGSRGNEKYPKEGYWKVLTGSDKKHRYVRVVKTSVSFTSFVELEVYCARDETQ